MAVDGVLDLVKWCEWDYGGGQAQRGQTESAQQLGRRIDRSLGDRLDERILISRQECLAYNKR